MMRKLNKDEYVHFARPTPGEVRVNHKSDYCLGDSNSMIVETKSNGDISAHCFRCGSGGFHPAKPYFKTRAERLSAAAARRDRDGHTALSSPEGNLVIGGIWLPEDADGEYRAFPKAVHAWLSKAGLTAVVIEREQFLWSEEKQCLYIPVRNAGELTGYVQRRFGEDGDRYRTLKRDRARFYGYYRNNERQPTKRIVMVEDVLSGLRTAEVCDTIALLGTHLSPTAQTTIMQGGYSEAVIFLDGDNPIVKAETRKIARKLPFLKVRIVETGTDPKYYSKEQLKEMICEDR